MSALGDAYRNRFLDAGSIPAASTNNKNKGSKEPLFYYFLSKGIEQGGSEAEENSPVDCFCRRGNEQSEAIGTGSAEKNSRRLHQ